MPAALLRPRRPRRVGSVNCRPNGIHTGLRAQRHPAWACLSRCASASRSILARRLRTWPMIAPYGGGTSNCTVACSATLGAAAARPGGTRRNRRGMARPAARAPAGLCRSRRAFGAMDRGGAKTLCRGRASTLRAALLGAAEPLGGTGTRPAVAGASCHTIVCREFRRWVAFVAQNG